MSRHRVKVTATFEYVVNTDVYGVRTAEECVEIDQASYEQGKIGFDELESHGKLVSVDWEVGEELV